MTGNSNRKIVYACTVCGREVGRDNLRTKRVIFRDMGVHGQTVRSRLVAWLCIIPQEDGSPSCLHSDEQWNLPKWATTPGMADTRLARHEDHMD